MWFRTLTPQLDERSRDRVYQNIYQPKHHTVRKRWFRVKSQGLRFPKHWREGSDGQKRQRETPPNLVPGSFWNEITDWLSLESWDGVRISTTSESYALKCCFLICLGLLFQSWSQGRSQNLERGAPMKETCALISKKKKSLVRRINQKTKVGNTL